MKTPAALSARCGSSSTSTTFASRLGMLLSGEEPAALEGDLDEQLALLLADEQGLPSLDASVIQCEGRPPH